MTNITTHSHTHTQSVAERKIPQGLKKANIVNQDDARNPSTPAASEDAPDSDDSHPSTMLKDQTGLDASIPQGEDIIVLDITRQELINAQRKDLELHHMGHSMPNQHKKKYDPSRFSSNFVSVSYLWSNSASPSFKLIRQVFLDL